MSHLSKLKIVAQQQKRMQNKTEHRRGKLLAKLDDQLGMVQALIDGGSTLGCVVFGALTKMVSGF